MTSLHGLTLIRSESTLCRCHVAPLSTVNDMPRLQPTDFNAAVTLSLVLDARSAVPLRGAIIARPRRMDGTGEGDGLIGDGGWPEGIHGYVNAGASGADARPSDRILPTDVRN